MSRYKIIIKDEKNKQSYEIGTFQDMDIKQLKDTDVVSTPGQVATLEYTGKHKCLLKLWSGAKDFDDIEGELT